MIPKKFLTNDRQAIYELLYADGETVDEVVAVQVRGDVIEVEYPLGHGSGLKVGRIEDESENEIRFTVADPQIVLLDGVVQLRKTDRRWD